MRRITTLLLFASVACLAAEPTPEGLLKAWLDAFNSGDKTTIETFLKANYPSETDHVSHLLDFRQQTGGLTLIKIEESSATKISGIVRERDSDRYARFQLEADPDKHQITHFGARLIPRPAEFPVAPRLSEQEALAALRAELDKQTAAGKFSGAVLVARNGKPILEDARGLADREKKIPNKLTTRFRIGSMNKMFTAVAVAQLAQAGKIKLDDPIGAYLKDYPNSDLAARVTIHQLLTHTGGTGDIFGPEFDKNRTTLRDLNDYVALYGKRAVAFEPGSRFEYSNYGFVLLGVLIEKVSGQSYYDYVREHIFKPAGMTSTDSLPESEAAPDRSVGYMRGDDGAPRPNTDTLPWRATSAGGGYSTVGDLLRFANALQSHKLLDAEYTKLVTTGKVAAGPSKYAYGFFDNTDDGVRYFGHGGGAPGMNGDLRIFPDSRYVIAVLSNLDPPAAQRIADVIGSRLPAK